MPFIRTTPAAQATGQVKEMYQRQQKPYGYVPSYAKAFCHRPELMALWAELQRGIRRHVEPRRFEIVTVAAAHALRSSSCSLAHGSILTEHYTPEQVCAIASDSDQSPLRAAERVMVRYARKVATDAASVTPEDVVELQSHGFDDAEIFDIAAIVAARAFFTKLLDGVGTTPDAPFADLDPVLRAGLTVGRQIDTGEPETL